MRHSLDISSAKGEITGGETQGKSPIRRSRDVPPSQESISNKLFRQTTKTKRSISQIDNHVDKIDPQKEKLIEGERVAAETVMSQALPPMPQRMRSNKTFQPDKVMSLEPYINETNNEKLDIVSQSDDRVSQVAIDYNLHMLN